MKQIQTITRPEKYIILDNQKFIVSNIEDTTFIEKALFFDNEEHAQKFKKDFCTACAKVIRVANKSYR